MKSLTEIRDDLNQVELLPKAILSLATKNHKSGKESGEKSVTLSFSVTLWHLICGAVIAFTVVEMIVAANAVVSHFRVRREVKAALKRERDKEDE